MKALIRKAVRATPLWGFCSDLARRRRLGLAAGTFWKESPVSQRMRNFYRQFLRPGAAIFDAGTETRKASSTCGQLVREQTPVSNRYYALDAVRAIAALSVLFSHIGGWAIGTERDALKSVMLAYETGSIRDLHG